MCKSLQSPVDCQATSNAESKPVDTEDSEAWCIWSITIWRCFSYDGAQIIKLPNDCIPGIMDQLEYIKTPEEVMLNLYRRGKGLEISVSTRQWPQTHQ